MADDLCQCPKCGRLHRDLGFGKPPSVEPPREMVRLARNAILKTDPTTQTLDEMAVTLAAEFTLVRSQAIEMCAGVADERAKKWHALQVHNPGDGCDMCSAAIERTNEADTIAASIRSLR